MSLNPVQPGLRLVNRSNSVAKVELRVQPGDVIEVADAATVVSLDRTPLTDVTASAKPAPEPEDEEPAPRKTRAKKS